MIKVIKFKAVNILPDNKLFGDKTNKDDKVTKMATRPIGGQMQLLQTISSVRSVLSTKYYRLPIHYNITVLFHNLFFKQYGNFTVPSGSHVSLV